MKRKNMFLGIIFIFMGFINIYTSKNIFVICLYVLAGVILIYADISINKII